MFAALVDSPIPAMTPEEISALVSKAVSEAVAPLAAQIESLQSANDLAENPPSLEDVAGMSEAELATLGLTPADVQEALEAAAQGEDAGDGEGEGEGELVTAGGESAGSEGAAPAPAATGLDAITKQLVQLSAEIASLKGQKAADAEDVLLSNIEAKVELLAGENARLTRALEAGGTPATVGVDRNNVKFFSAGKDAGEFENLVQFNIEEKKLSKLQAFQAAIKENPAAYDEHLVRSGVRKAK
jgi:multidrug efflux pump subunit AcrB